MFEKILIDINAQEEPEFFIIAVDELIDEFRSDNFDTLVKEIEELNIDLNKASYILYEVAKTNLEQSKKIANRWIASATNADALENYNEILNGEVEN